MATYGLRTRDASGLIATDVTHRLPRVLGRFIIPGGADGSHYDSRLVGREGFAQIYPSSINTFNMLVVPTVTVDPDGYIRWTYNSTDGFRYGCAVVFGVLG